MKECPEKYYICEGCCGAPIKLDDIINCHICNSEICRVCGTFLVEELEPDLFEKFRDKGVYYTCSKCFNNILKLKQDLKNIVYDWIRINKDEQ